MPSRLHEMLVEMFCQRPALVADLLSGLLSVDVPAWQQVRVESSDLSERKPTSYRADAAITFRVDDESVEAAVVEIQLRPDEDKRYSWPVYVATLRARERCPTVLLVVCTDASTAAWAAKPIDLGHPGCTLAPLVLGPDKVPVVTDVGQASRLPELAVFSAIAHPTHPEHERILSAMLGGMRRLDSNHVDLYTEIAMLALPAAARRSLENMMDLATYEPQSEWFKRKLDELADQRAAKRAPELAAELAQELAAELAEGLAAKRAVELAEGLAAKRAVELAEELAPKRAAELAKKLAAQTEAGAVLTVLDARGVEVPDSVRAQITACTDLDQLRTWVRRAATANSAKELFDR